MTHQLSLFHHVVPNKSELAGKPPLLLLLHGYGANEDDLFSLASDLDGRFLIVSVRAPIVLAPWAYAWFNLGFSPRGVTTMNQAEAVRSLEMLRQFIGEVVAAYECDPQAVYLMGFSQGAMMSLTVALNQPGIAAGVVVMSGRLLPQTISQIPNQDALIGFPIFVAHGTADAVLSINDGREARQRLSELPVDLTYREYPMGHTISQESLSDASAWLTQRLDRAQSRVTT